MINLVRQCLFSPRLYKVYKDGPIEQLYEPQALERWADKVILTANTIWNITYYMSPIIGIYLYKRGGISSANEFGTLAQLFGGVGGVLILCLIVRGVGRALNPKYREFVVSLTAPTDNLHTHLKQIRKYDFDFASWPASYTMPKKHNKNSWLLKYPFNTHANQNLPVYQRSIIQLLGFLATYTFGLRLIYPGSLTIIQYLLYSPLLEGRTQLVELHKGERNKLITADGNDIDAMFVDNRGFSSKGNTLVICSEGNSGFYEIGIMTTPLKAGYSAIGWNHPGFAGSTGYPFPEQERNAIDAVMQFAINELGFEPENIVLFGWSIGGYTVTWAALKYPVKGLILDATFDDLLVLAINHMPSSWSLLVKEVVRSYVDLNIGDLIVDYKGPVQLVRRTEDEIICMRPGSLDSNRCNDLLLYIIATRHPEYSTNEHYSNLWKLIVLPDAQRAKTMENETFSPETLKIIQSYMIDYKSTHCSPLPENILDNIIKKFKQV